MKLTKIDHVEDFLAAVNECEGDVTLTSQYGDKYNLKSLLSQYVAIGALLGDKGDEFGVCRLAAACLHGVSEI